MNKREKNEILFQSRQKTPWVAGLLSLVIVGAGSMYAGKTSKGFALMGISLLLWIVLLGWVVWIFAPYIAIKDAKEYNKLLRLELDLDIDTKEIKQK